tara:strand:+ start:202 stop:420 length:219 start_codon:yes stop_codon:yes gene_type:complete
MKKHNLQKKQKETLEIEPKGSLDNNTESVHKGFSQAVEALLKKSLWKDPNEKVEELQEPVVEEKKDDEKEER